MVRSGPFEGDLAFMFFFHFSICFSSENLFLLVPFSSFFEKFHCWHQYQSLIVDVSFVVGAPGRCGVLTTSEGPAGIGFGPCLGECMIQIPRVGWRLFAC